MRFMIWTAVLIVACAPERQQVAASGASSDAGVDSVDAGNAAATCGSADAGPAGELQLLPCPATLEVLWSRTFTTTDVDFRGAADQAGNLYWVEYDPPLTSTGPAMPWLVSADSAGVNRYRTMAPGAHVDRFVLAGSSVVMTQGLLINAYATATGALSWSLNLSSPQPAASDVVTGLVDLGNGDLAFATRIGIGASGLYVVDARSGRVAWSTNGGYDVLGSDGAANMLVKSGTDIFVLDSSGHQRWRQQVTGTVSLLGWASSPWLSFRDRNEVRPTAEYVAAPGSWFAATLGKDLGFSFSWSDAATAPDNVDVLRGCSVVASASLAGTTSYDGMAAFPFIAGDHMVMLGQSWHGQPALCYPSAPGAAWFARVDAHSLYQCPLSLEANSGILAAALLPGRLIVGRVTYTSYSCGYRVNPVTIEAYDLPGEALSTSGWVQREGSPGLGRRPLTQ